MIRELVRATRPLLPEPAHSREPIRSRKRCGVLPVISPRSTELSGQNLSAFLLALIRTD